MKEKLRPSGKSTPLGLFLKGAGGARSGGATKGHFEAKAFAILGGHQARFGDDIAVVVRLQHHQGRPAVPEGDFSFLELALAGVDGAGEVYVSQDM